MHIHISAHSLGRRIGGDETHRSKLLSALAEVDQVNHYTLLTNRPSPLVERLTQHPNFKDKRLQPGGSWYRLMLGEPLATWRDHADLLHAQVFAPFWLTCPLVLELPDVSFLVYPEHYPGLKGLRLRWFVPWAARRATRITTVSEASRQDIARLLRLPAEKIVVIPNGVEHALFHPCADTQALETFRHQYQLPKKFILYVGNIQPRKNLPRLIEAFRQLKQKGLPHQLVLVGAAQWAVSDTFRAATRDGLEREVIFTGYVPERDLPWFYRAAEVLAYPSLLEGFGLPLVEAMACGTPVVTSNSVAIRETVGDAAIVVDPLNTQAIADGIHTVISDTAVRQHLIAKGLARAQQFTWAETARCTLQVYEEVGAARKI